MKWIYLAGLVLILFFGCVQEPSTSANNKSDQVTNDSDDSPINLIENVTIQPSNDLKKVKTWFYYLNEDLDFVLDEIVDSDYDMIVIEPVFTEKENTDYDIQSSLSKIKNSSGANVKNKIVLAYIDIGQAESYRYYWLNDWKIGSPEFIAGADPDLWDENYPVAFWKSEWQDIWFEGDDAQLNQLIDAGFDGVYLDWVEAYSDPNVLAIAITDNVNATSEMKKFVKEIKDYGTNKSPGFIVISQNAAELVEDDDYVSSIDAIAQEQVWFDGSAIGLPEGDCPLPATDEDIDTKEYEKTLSSGCLRMYVELPESTLHVSSAEYIEYLKIAQSKGLPIFTVDYALEKKNIDIIYNRSRSLSFIPFVSNRPLNQFVSTIHSK